MAPLGGRTSMRAERGARRLHPRLRLDIGWSDLLVAGAAGLAAFERTARARRIEERFSPRRDAFVALSARSGFDLYLTALALPAGSEVLVSGLTIPHMARLVEHHGLVVVPFALD